MVEPKDGAV